MEIKSRKSAGFDIEDSHLFALIRDHYQMCIIYVILIRIFMWHAIRIEITVYRIYLRKIWYFFVTFSLFWRRAFNIISHGGSSAPISRCIVRFAVISWHILARQYFYESVWVRSETRAWSVWKVEVFAKPYNIWLIPFSYSRTYICV